MSTPESQQSYISPSDTIMSPTTKKLSEMKGKRFASGKPQSLFAKTLGKQAQGQSQSQSGEAGENLGRATYDDAERSGKENMEAAAAAATGG